jgi:hypothetical protein
VVKEGGKQSAADLANFVPIDGIGASGSLIALLFIGVNCCTSTCLSIGLEIPKFILCSCAG